MATDAPVFGLITGSGLHEFGEGETTTTVETPYGVPSAPIRRVRIGGSPVCVLPRHGAAHEIPPHLINYRANAWALESLGVTAVISINTVGFIPADLQSGSLAVPRQLIDYTWGRQHTIFNGRGAGVRHVDMTEPFSGDLCERLAAAASAAGIPCHVGGVYGVTQGPRLETAAEVDRLERDGVDFVGMTAMPEVSLLRELGLDVACLSMLVNPAAGRGDSAIHASIEASTDTARRAAIRVLEAFFRA
ncbi:MAG: S-methyl-5'-thioinosine phosphorylase [Pseudomonadota bacterium]